MNRWGESSIEFGPGQAVVYIPDHVMDDGFKYHPGFREINHNDSQFGIVKSANDKFVFVQFFPGLITAGKTSTARACKPENLYYYKDKDNE